MSGPKQFQMSGNLQLGGGALGFGGKPSAPAGAAKPDPNNWAQNAINVARGGQGESILEDAKRMLKAYPNHPGVLQALAEIHVGIGELKSAEAYGRKLVKATPNNPMPLIIHATLLMKLYRNADATRNLRQAAGFANNNPRVLSNIATILEKLDKMDDALRIYQRVNELEPNNPYHLQRLASVERFLGDLDAAEEHCDLSIANNPKEHFVYFMRSGLRKQTPERNHTAELEERLQQGFGDKRAHTYVGYALAKEYEDLKEYEASFRHLSETSAVQRSMMEYDVEVDLKTIDEIKQYFNANYFKQPRENNPAPDPIFIIGMPRTGTTLMERILGSHSKVQSMGELGNFGRSLVRGVKEKVGSRHVAEDERVRLTTQLNFRDVGQNYLDSVSEKRNSSPYFIDKLPYNYLNVGPIHAALPNAKLICSQRHPLDTCYAIYKQLFGLAYPFSYTFEELGRYYAAYRSLMDHWENVLPEGTLLKVRYEDVVADQEGQTKRILDYCGLDWEDEVSEFYKNETASTTASAAQVRQPVYKSSVQKWRNYETQLQPLMDILREHGVTDLD